MGWQRSEVARVQPLEPIWDVVRTAVDTNPVGGQFILTGSTTSRNARLHTGATRMVVARLTAQWTVPPG